MFTPHVEYSLFGEEVAEKFAALADWIEVTCRELWKPGM